MFVVGWLVGRSVSLKKAGNKKHFNVPIGVLVIIRAISDSNGGKFLNQNGRTNLQQGSKTDGQTKGLGQQKVGISHFYL